MQLAYCDGCGFLVPEEDMQAGTARIDPTTNKLYCAKCAAAAPASESQQFQSANMTEASYKTGARPVVAKRTTGAITKTGQQRAVGARATQAGLAPVGPPSGSHGAADAPSKLKPVLFFGIPALVCIGVLVMVLTAEKPKKFEPIATPAPTEPPPQDTPKPTTATNTANAKPVMERGMLGAVVTERGKPAGSIMEDTATEMLTEANAFREANPKELLAYRDMLQKIVDRYRSTASGAEAWKAIGQLPPGVRDEPSPNDKISSVRPFPALDDAEWNGATNLIPLIDPKTHAMKGTWQVYRGVLVSDETQHAKIEIPFTPPEEYDFRIVFARLSGNGDVSQTFPVNGSPVTWVMDSWGGTKMGFGLVGGKDVQSNPTLVPSKAIQENNRKTSAVVRVRKNELRAYVNGRFLTRWEPSMGALSEWPTWAPKNKATLSVGSYSSPTAFYRAEILPYQPNMGLWYSYFKSDGKVLQEFLRGESYARLAVDFGDKSVGKDMPVDFFGISATGILRAPTDGVYTFRLSGDDSAKLFINGKLLVEHQYSKDGPKFRDSEVTLPKGDNEIRVVHIEDHGNATFYVKWKLPGATEFTNVPPTALWHDPAKIEQYQKP